MAEVKTSKLIRSSSKEGLNKNYQRCVGFGLDLENCLQLGNLGEKRENNTQKNKNLPCFFLVRLFTWGDKNLNCCISSKGKCTPKQSCVSTCEIDK